MNYFKLFFLLLFLPIQACSESNEGHRGGSGADTSSSKHDVEVEIDPTPDLQEAPRTFTNPIQEMGADPWMIQHEGKYYYSESNGGSKIYVKEIPGITKLSHSTRREDVSIFSPDQSDPTYRYAIWGPHLNYVQGRWYIYYCGESTPDKSFKTQRMWVMGSTTDSPFGPYEDLGEVIDSNDKDWAIDGSVIERANGDLYFVWSGIADVNVSGAQSTYIAKMISPTRIDRTTITQISRATEVWEKSYFPIQEGQRPLVIDKNGKTIIMYSANASWTDSYCLGSLTNITGDYLNPKAWRKSSKPLFFRTPEVFGPGGASYVKSPDGTEDWIIYHSARKQGSGWYRKINAQPFSWNQDGSPNFGIPVPPGEALAVPSGEE